MEEITLQALLEAGCHFGHKSERWHPKASAFIYTEKDGIHIIDLAKTKAGLEAAVAYVRDVVAGGGEVVFVGTKRQAQGVVRQEAETAGAPYLVDRWIGGFLTNWDQIHKNIAKINRLTEEQKVGAWKKYPKHEQHRLARYVEKLKVFYGGVLSLNTPPAALFVIDVKKEDVAVREAKRTGIPVVAVVDTNSNPTGVDYVIPANDDAVGSISYITHVIAQAYKEGKEKQVKEAEDAAKKQEALQTPQPPRTPEEKPAKEKPAEKEAEKPKRGRPKKTA